MDIITVSVIGKSTPQQIDLCRLKVRAVCLP